MPAKFPWGEAAVISRLQSAAADLSCAVCQGSSSMPWSDGPEVLNIELSVLNETKIKGCFMAKPFCS